MRSTKLKWTTRFTSILTIFYAGCCDSPMSDLDLMKDIPLDQNAKMVLAHAVNEAEMDNSFYIYTDHLLRGMLRFPYEASVALESIQVNLESARAASRRH